MTSVHVPVREIRKREQLELFEKYKKRMLGPEAQVHKKLIRWPPANAAVHGWSGTTGMRTCTHGHTLACACMGLRIVGQSPHPLLRLALHSCSVGAAKITEEGGDAIKRMQMGFFRLYRFVACPVVEQPPLLPSFAALQPAASQTGCTPPHLTCAPAGLKCSAGSIATSLWASCLTLSRPRYATHRFTVYSCVNTLFCHRFKLSDEQGFLESGLMMS